MDVLGIDIVNIFTWLAIGLVVFVVDSQLLGGNNKSTLSLGSMSIAGAILGGLLSPLVFGSNLANFDLNSVATALIGSLILTVLVRMIQGSSGHIKTIN